VDFEFDPKKDEANRRQHGVSLDLARELDWNAMQVTLDDASRPNEERWIGGAECFNLAVYGFVNARVWQPVMMAVWVSSSICSRWQVRH